MVTGGGKSLPNLMEHFVVDVEALTPFEKIGALLSLFGGILLVFGALLLISGGTILIGGIITLWGDFQLGPRLLTFGGILLTFGGVIIINILKRQQLKVKYRCDQNEQSCLGGHLLGGPPSILWRAY